MRAQPSRTLPGVVAVVGCDGSGKSTLAADLVLALREFGPVEFLYLGQSSGNIGRWIKSRPLIGPVIGRYLEGRAEGAHGEEESTLKTSTALVVFLLSRWRLHKFRGLLAKQRSGITIITDRYPQAEVPGFYFDGPGIDAARARGRLVRWLAAREQRFYEWMAGHLPTLVLRLQIDADTAHARKPDHKLSVLREKTAVVPELLFNGATILDLDSCQPYEQVLESASQAVQQALHTPRNSPQAQELSPSSPRGS